MAVQYNIICTLYIHIQDGYSPLCVASQEGHTDVVDILLRKGADVNQTTTNEVCATINLCVSQFLLCTRLSPHTVCVHVCVCVCVFVCVCVCVCVGCGLLREREGTQLIFK